MKSRDFYIDITRLKKLNEFLISKDFFIERGYPYYSLDTVPSELLKISFPVFSPLNYFDGGIKKVLDVGCGAGLDMFLIRNSFPDIKVFGFDISMPLLIENKRLSGNIGNLIQAEASLPPFKLESFDFVVINGVFNIIKDKEAFFNSMYKVLKKSGLIFVADIFKKRDIEEIPDEGEILSIKSALRLKELFKLFNKCGFSYSKGRFDVTYTKEFGLFGVLWKKN